MPRLTTTPHVPRRPACVAAIAASGAVAVAVALAGCGTSGAQVSAGTGTTGGGSGPSKLIELAHCMRAHGLTNFPDSAGPGGGFVIQRTPNSDGVKINGVSFSGPAFQQAQAACKRYMPNQGKPPTIPKAKRAALLAQAACMRRHGVPDFPDPTFPASGGVMITGNIDPSSPAFEKASQACGGPFRVKQAGP